MFHRKTNIFAAWIVSVFLFALSFITTVVHGDSANELIGTNDCKNVCDVPDSLSASTLPKACFLPDDRNFFLGRNDVCVLNSSTTWLISLIFITVYLVYSSQVPDKHTKRFSVLLI